MTTGLRFFYRRIHVSGLHHIPSTGPVIIIANHHSSLMDAALLGILIKRPLYFYARGDVFANRFISRLLWQFHMMPVHGHQGKNTLSLNRDSFSSGKKILQDGGVIVFFPESSSHTERQLLPFRKGVFRLAFDTAETAGFAFDIPIVPIGITYDHPTKGRCDAQVHAGAPLFLANYVNEYKTNNAAALLRLCKDAWERMSKLVLHVPDKARLQTVEQALIIARNNMLKGGSGWKLSSASKLEYERLLCSDINHATGQDFTTRQQAMAAYFNALSTAGLHDINTETEMNAAGWKKMLLCLGFPLCVAGVILSALPALLARYIADKKVTRKDFYSWIYVACYSFLYLGWFIVLATTGFWLGWQYTGLLLLSVFLAGLFTFWYAEQLRQYRYHTKWAQLPDIKKKQLITLRPQLKKL